MTLNFDDKICELINQRIKKCIPLGLYKIWFRSKNSSSLEGLGDLLGYSDKVFEEMIQYSSLSKRNGKFYFALWQEKLHIHIEVKEVFYNGEQFKTVRFGESISVGDSPEALIPGNNTVSDGNWQNKNYTDRGFMEIFRLEYIDKYLKAYNIRSGSRLHQDIVRLIDCRKYQSRTEPEEEGEDAIGNTRNYLSIDCNSAIDDAPHLTDFINMNFTKSEKEDIFIQELKKHNEFHMTVASTKGYTVNHWFNFPTSDKTSDSEAEGNLSIGPKQLRRYKWKNSIEMIEQLCEVIGGTVQRGHHILLDQLLEMNDEWTKNILRSNGINAFNSLNVEETLALQAEANLTNKQRIIINQYLKNLNGNTSLFAGEKEISKSSIWTDCEPPKMCFHTLIYYVDKDGGNYLEFEEEEAINRVKKTLTYFYCDPFEVLKCRLDYFRDIIGPSKFVSIGMVLDNDQSKRLPLYIFITIIGDHDGSEMKVIQLNTLRNGDGQRYRTCIGQFEAKESHFLFENTIFPPINSSIEMDINNSMLLVVEWGAEELGFDYLFYPKHLFLVTDNPYELPSLLAWSSTVRGIDGVKYNQTEHMTEYIGFKFSDIPLDCRVRNINIVVFSSGHAANQFEILNSGHLYSCRCMKCNLKSTEWQDQSVVGELYNTNADFERMHSESQLSVEELRDMIVDDIEEQKIVDLHTTLLGKEQQEAHRGGFVEIGLLLLPAIEVKDNFNIPVSHIKLGLTLLLYNRFFIFIMEQLEPENEEIRVLRVNTIPSLTLEYEIECENLIQNETGPYMRTIEMYDRVEVSKKNLSDAIKRLQVARKNNWNKPVKSITEEIMAKYGIVTQAYHSHSLRGKQYFQDLSMNCHRLLMNRDDILYDIQKSWVKEATGRDDLGFDIIKEIEQFISEMSDLLEALDYCCSILAKQNYWFNDEEINKFQSIATYLGLIWREYLKNKLVPQKLHMLEKHASQFLFKWRNTGNFGDDPVKQEDYEENKFNRLFCNKNNWEERNRFIRTRKALYDNTKIAYIQNNVQVATNRKRLSNNFIEEDERRQKKATQRVELIKKINTLDSSGSYDST